MNPVFPILIVSFLIGALLLALWRIRKLEEELAIRDKLLDHRDAVISKLLNERGAEAHTP